MINKIIIYGNLLNAYIPTHAVTQGSVCGPIFFIINTITLPLSVL